jgi:hypothetical protein
MSDGTLPVSNDLVNNNMRMSVRISIFSFSTLPAMVSGPVALLGFMFLMSLYHLTGTTQMSRLFSKKDNTTQVTTDLYP